MHRLECKNMGDGVERSVVLAGEKIYIAGLVPAFGEWRRVPDQLLHVEDRFAVIEAQLRLSRLVQELLGFVVGKAPPECPEAIFDGAGLGVAFGRGEFREKCGSRFGLTVAEA